jgi:hypothetical protein
MIEQQVLALTNAICSKFNANEVSGDQRGINIHPRMMSVGVNLASNSNCMKVTMLSAPNAISGPTHRHYLYIYPVLPASTELWRMEERREGNSSNPRPYPGQLTTAQIAESFLQWVYNYTREEELSTD